MKKLITLVVLIAGLMFPSIADATVKKDRSKANANGIQIIDYIPLPKGFKKRPLIARAAGNISMEQLFADSDAIALNFWHARNVWMGYSYMYAVGSPCGHADWAGCHYYDFVINPNGSSSIDVQAFYVLRAMVDQDVNGGTTGWSAQAAVCSIITHEEGHHGGLAHTATGVMRPNLMSVYSDWPYDCRVYGRDH